MRANVFILSLLAVICVGCDYCRSGYYRLSFQPAQVGVSRVSSREQVIHSIRSTLKQRRFEEWTGKRIIWRKGGAQVEWETSESGDLTLKIWAFGGKTALRDSEQIELDLLRLVTLQPDVRVVRVEPPPIPAE